LFRVLFGECPYRNSPYSIFAMTVAFAMLRSVSVLHLNLWQARHFIMLILEYSDGSRDFICVFHLYLLLIFMHNILREFTLGIWMVLQLIVYVQFCFWHMCKCWHFGNDSDAP